VGWGLVALCLLVPASLFGQAASPKTTDEGVRLSASASSAYQFKSNIDGGGDVSASYFGVEAGGEKRLTDAANLGIRVNYARENYNFSDTNGLLVRKPWGQIDRVGLNLRLGYKLNDQWRIGGGPVIQYAGETNAKSGDSFLYGGIVSAVYQVNPNLMLGLGAGVFYRLEETKLFASPIVSWKITDRLSLGNSYHLGVAGPAGLELAYKIDDNWEVAAGGGHRSSRFRLDKDGSTPGGIGENNSWPLYARLSRKLGSAVHLDLYGGAAFAGKLKLQDSKGNDIHSVDYNTSALLGFNLRGDF